MDGPTLAITLASKSATQLNVLAARAVDLACGGNVKAIGLIAERIEGRAGIRSGETDPASDVAREGVQQAIEDLVTRRPTTRPRTTRRGVRPRPSCPS